MYVCIQENRSLYSVVGYNPVVAN